MLHVRHTAELLLKSRFSAKLLAGFSLEEHEQWKATFTQFWTRFRDHDGNHPIFAAGLDVGMCVPVQFHGDEGTGHRRKPVLQLSWGTVLTQGVPALDRLFLITSCPAKLYSSLNAGIEAGNRVLDRLTEAAAKSFRNAFFAGIETKFGTVHLVCIGVAGDHVWHTKVYRCMRNHEPGLHQAKR